MKINGDAVNTGDHVWHGEFGVGVVGAVFAQECQVHFQSASVPVTFADGGARQGRQELYWQAPILVQATKNTPPDVFAKLRLSFNVTLELMRRGG